MKQNTLSIDFKFARVSGNTYTFGYDVYRSVTASTEITVQNWNNKAAIPAYYDNPNQRLYAYGVDGYWAVFANSLTFTSITPESARIDALETRVSVLEGNDASLTTRVSTAEDNITSLTTRVDSIVSALNSIIVYRSATGNPAVFSDAVAENLKEISAIMPVTQSGSGDPSPTNVRPITSYNSVTITRTGTGGANSKSVTVSLVDDNNQTLSVCGGTLDAATGILAVTHKVVTLSSSVGFNKSGRTDLPDGFSLFYTNAYVSNYIFSDAAFSGGDTNPNGVIMYSNYYPIGATGYMSLPSKADFGIGIGQSGNYSNIGIMTDAASTIQAFYQWLDAQDPPIQIAYPLETPVIYRLTPVQLSALSGYNSVSSNAGNVSVIYVSRLNLG